MSVKNQAVVERYERAVIRLQAVLANLTEFAQSLPAAVDGELPTLDYHQVYDVERMAEAVGLTSEIADKFGR